MSYYTTIGPLEAAGSWEKIVETEITGAAVSSITVTGLDLDADKAYIMLFTVVNPTASSYDIRIFCNNDTTDTNYYTQLLEANGASIGYSRSNNAASVHSPAGESCFAVIHMMRDPDGYPRWLNQVSVRDPAAVFIIFRQTIWTSTTNVTRLDFVSISGGIGIGSKLIIFKVSK